MSLHGEEDCDLTKNLNLRFLATNIENKRLETVEQTRIR
jgi:hypothetical protein